MGRCAEATLAMAAVFPELTRVRGHYLCWVWGEREHWWLVEPNGEIVDPTADQFPSKGGGVYVPWDEASPSRPESARIAAITATTVSPVARKRAASATPPTA